MRQKFGVALAIAVIALSGARETSKQFHQLKSLAAGWTGAGAWGSLLVYAVGTAEGVTARRRQTPLVASNTATCGGEARGRRAAKAVRKARRAKGEAAGPKLAIEELAMSFGGAESALWSVDEFEVASGREGDAKAGALGREFFNTNFGGGAGNGPEAARAELESELLKLGGADLLIRIARSEAVRAGVVKSRTVLRRPAATRRKVDARRGEEPAAEPDGDAEADYETTLNTPSSSGLLNCDEEPRR